MIDTSKSLLSRLRNAGQPRDWNFFHSIYQPFLTSLFRARGLPDSDVDDLVQDVLLAFVEELPTFKHNGAIGAFRTWLRETARRRYLKWTMRRRPGELSSELLEGLANPQSELGRKFDREHDAYVIRRALERIRPSFEESTWRAFSRVCLDEWAPEQAAEELRTTRNAVYVAKSKVLSGLRIEVSGIVDDSSFFAKDS